MAPKRNILIADDAAFMRMMLRDILEKNSFIVIDEAQNGIQAVEKYRQNRPDLVMLDVTMPEMDGLEALKQIKQYDPTAKVIMCSAMGQEKVVVDSIRSGACDFIVKPFKADRVIQTLKRVLGP